jgi:hypothetical protein
MSAAQISSQLAPAVTALKANDCEDILGRERFTLEGAISR